MMSSSVLTIVVHSRQRNYRHHYRTSSGQSCCSHAYVVNETLEKRVRIIEQDISPGFLVFEFSSTCI